MPSAKGFGKGIERQIGGDVAKAGKSGGEQYAAGMGSSLKGAGKAIFAPLAAAAAAVGVGNFLKDALGEARESQKVGAITANVIKTTGGAAKVTAAQVGELAGAISAKTGTDDEAIQSGANLLLTFKNVRNEVGRGNDIFNRATQAATDLSAAGFGDLNGASKQLGKALNDPIKGMTALARSGVTFTEQQKEQIKTLVESGKTLDAQKIILGEVESQVGGAAAASATAGEKMAVAFGNFKESVGTALLPVVDRFATVVTTRIIPALSGFLAGLQNGSGAGGRLVAVVGTIVGALAGSARLVNNNRTTFAALAVVMGAVAAATAAHTVALAVNSGALRAWFVQTRVVQAATRAWAAVQWLLNIALNANPIGIVVVSLAALGAALVVAYKRSDAFRAIVQTAFRGVQTAASVAWRVIGPILSTLARWVGTILVVAFRLYAAVVKTSFRGLQIAASVAWRLVGPILSTLAKWIGTTLVVAFRVYAAAVKTEWAIARGAVVGGWKIIRGVFVALRTFVMSSLPGAFEVGRAAITAKWSAAKDRIKNVWDKSLKPVFDRVNTMIKTTVPNAFEAGRVAMGAKWSTARDRIKNVWDKSLRPVFDHLNTMIKTTVPGAFSTGVEAIKTAWDRIKGYARVPVRFIVNTILNDGLIAAFNKIDKTFGNPVAQIKRIQLPKGFAEGTEDHRAQIASPGQMRLWAEPETGGEAYIPLSERKRTRSTAILRDVAKRFGYGLTPFANGGTLVQAGKRLRSLGYSVSEGPPPFGPVHRVHAAHSRHYDGMAIDVNHGAGTSKVEQAALGRIVPYLKGLGLRIIFMAPGHYNHLHAEVPKAPGLLSRIGGLLKGAAGAVGNFLDPSQLIRGPLNGLLGKIPGAGSAFGKLVAGMPKSVATMLVNKAKEFVGLGSGDTKDFSGGGGGEFGGGAGRWRGLVSRVVAELHQPQSAVAAVLRRIGFESGGNPNAVNLTDSNARAGHPSQGLMQVIPGTFNAYAGQYRKRGIRDPLANIFAGSNYALHRYHSLAAIDPRVRPKGYDQGGWLKPGLTMVENKTGKPEAVFNPAQLAALTGGGGPTFNGPVYTTSPVEFVREMESRQRLHDALHPTFG